MDVVTQEEQYAVTTYENQASSYLRLGLQKRVQRPSL